MIGNTLSISEATTQAGTLQALITGRFISAVAQNLNFDEIEKVLWKECSRIIETAH